MLSTRRSRLRCVRQLCAPPAGVSRSGRGRSHSVRGRGRAIELERETRVRDGRRAKIRCSKSSSVNSDAMPGGQIMRKYFILPLLLVVVVLLSAPIAGAQTTGTVKGTCKDSEGKPIAQADVEWTGVETGHTYKLKTNNKGEYFSLGIVPGKYNIKLSKDGKELFHFTNVPVGLDETPLEFDLKKEQFKAAEGQGLTPEQARARAEAAAKAASETKTAGTLNQKINADKAA